MDGPLALGSQRRRSLRGRDVSITILEVAKRSIDRAEAVGAAGGDHAGQAKVPLVAGVVGVEAADTYGSGAEARGEVGDAKVHCFDAFAGLGDSLDVGQTQRRLYQYLNANLPVEVLSLFDLRQHGLDHVDVA